MTPARVVELVARALGRRPNPHELADWSAVLATTNDDDADAGLVLHRANSPHAPTPSDVRKAAIAIANDRALRAVTELRRRELATGIAQEGESAGKPFVPMPPQVRAQLAEFEMRHQMPAGSDVEDEVRMAQARAEIAARRPVPLEEPADV